MNVNFLNNADIDGKATPPDGAPNVMMAAGGTQLDNIFDADAIDTWQFHVDWKNPKNTKVTGPEKIAVAPYHYLCDGQLTNCVPQPGTERSARRAGRQDHVAPRLPQGRRPRVDRRRALGQHRGRRRRRALVRVPDRQGARRVTLHQQGTYAPDGFYRWMASPAIDKSGNIGIGYSFGGTPNFAGQRFAGRLAGDPPGVLTLKRDGARRGRSAQTDHAAAWEDYTHDRDRSDRRLHRSGTSATT